MSGDPCGSRVPNSSWVARLHPTVAPVLAFLITGVAFLPPACRGIDFHHDGIMLKPALDVLSGQTLHRETFTQYGALTTYLQVAFLWGMGPSLLSLKIGTVLFYGVAASFLVMIWRILLPPSLVCLAFLAWLLLPSFNSPHPSNMFYCWSSVYALAFQSMALYFLLRSLRGVSSVNPFLCGVTSALVLWCKMPVGVFHEAAVVVFFAIMIYATPQKRRFLTAFATFLAGSILVHATFLAHLWTVGALDAWYYQNFVLPASWVATDARSRAFGKVSMVVGRLFMLVPIGRVVSLFQEANVPWRAKSGLNVLPVLAIAGLLVGLLAFPQLRRSASACGTEKGGARPLLWTLLPLAIYGVIAMVVFAESIYEPDCALSFAVPVVILSGTMATFVRCFARPGRLEAPDGPPALALACGLVCLASWLQFYPANDSWHRFWAVAPGIGVLFSFLLRSTGGRVLPLATVILAFLMPLMVDRTARIVAVNGTEYHRIGGDSPLAGVDVPAAEAPRLTALLDAVGRQVAARPDVPMVSFSPDALYGTLTRNLRNPSPFYVDWSLGDDGLASEQERAAFWTLVGVPDYDAKRAAFIAKFQPILCFPSQSHALLNAYEAMGFRRIFEDEPDFKRGVVLMARATPGTEPATGTTGSAPEKSPDR